MEPEGEAGGEGHGRTDRSRHAVRSGGLEGEPYDDRTRALRPAARVEVRGSLFPPRCQGEGRVSATDNGARLVMRMELRPKVMLRLLVPILGRFMHKQEERNLAAIKEALEDSGASAGRPGA